MITFILAALTLHPQIKVDLKKIPRIAVPLGARAKIAWVPAGWWRPDGSSLQTKIYKEDMAAGCGVLDQAVLHAADLPCDFVDEKEFTVKLMIANLFGPEYIRLSDPLQDDLGPAADVAKAMGANYVARVMLLTPVNDSHPIANSNVSQPTVSLTGWIHLYSVSARKYLIKKQYFGTSLNLVKGQLYTHNGLDALGVDVAKSGPIKVLTKAFE